MSMPTINSIEQQKSENPKPNTQGDRDFEATPLEWSEERYSATQRQLYQTLIETKTGIWSVFYNGENRPTLWTSSSTNVVMSFDRMGRRVSYTETVGVITNAHRTFVYDNYLQIADNSGCRYLWDPTEPVATRPLVFIISTPNAQPATHYYAHDGNKNVSELVDGNGAVTAHYEYAPFGDVTVAAGNLAFSNPFRFSSEYADDALGLVYYNYRHYEPVTGRWGRRDPLSELAARSLYSFAKNSNVLRFDYIGLSDCCECGRCQIRVLNTGDPVITDFIIVSGLGKEYRIQGVPSLVNEIGGKIFGDIQKTANEILEIINRAGSSGRLFQPRIRAGRVIEVERRDCRHSFWFFGSCRWRYWVKDQVMIRSDWSSPDNSENYDNQEIYNWVNPFDMEDAVRIAKELYESAKAIAEKEIGNVGIIESVSKMTGCEIMEGDNE